MSDDCSSSVCSFRPLPTCSRDRYPDSACMCVTCPEVGNFATCLKEKYNLCKPIETRTTSTSTPLLETTSAPAAGGSQSISGFLIAGIVAGAFILIILIAFLVVCVKRRQTVSRRQHNYSDNENMERLNRGDNGDDPGGECDICKMPIRECKCVKKRNRPANA